MTSNLIDILINASWKGGGAIKKAGGELRQFGNNAAQTSVEMAAARQRSMMLNRALGILGKEIALGNMTVKEATEVYEELTTRLVDVGEVAPKAEKGVAGIGKTLITVTAAMATAAVAGKKLFSTIKEGAELELVRKRFDRLSLSIGTTGQALELDLGIATRGLITDSQQLALATDLIALGLANSHDEAVRMARASAELDFNLNQLETTLTDQTTAGFDALGISVDGFELKVQKLEDAGYSADEAFRFAFVEQAEDQIEKVGSKAETTAGQIAMIGAAWSDSIDAMKEDTTDAFSGIIDYLAEGIDSVNDAQAAVRDLGEDFEDLGKRAGAVKAVRDSLDRPFTMFPGIKSEEMLLRLLALLTMTSDSLEEQKQILESYDIEFDKHAITMGVVTVSWEQFNNALKESRMAELADEAAAADQKFFNMAITVESVTEEVEELNEKANEFYTLLSEGLEGITADTLGGVVRNTLEQTMRVLSDEVVGKRLDIWLDFQAELTDISEREGEHRAIAEARYEERRTDIVDQYGERRARTEEQSARTIDRIREDTAERQAQIREDNNERLSDLEQDHLDRMQEIIENANLQLLDAASRLDARAVARIQRERDDALGDETDAYKKQRKDIQRQIDERIKAEKEASDKRIKREEENNQLRLQQMDDAHDEQLHYAYSFKPAPSISSQALLALLARFRQAVLIR